jgi:hypothetical protein
LPAGVTTVPEDSAFTTMACGIARGWAARAAFCDIKSRIAVRVPFAMRAAGRWWWWPRSLEIQRAGWVTSGPPGSFRNDAG